MTNITKICCMLIALTSIVVNASETKSFPNLQGPWFGQETPGLIAEPFAPATVSIDGRYEFGVSFSQDLTEMYFTTLDIIEGVDTDPQIYYSKVENNIWTKPERANFTKSKMAYELTPHASLNENRVYFTGRKPGSKDSGVWYVIPTKSGFSEAKRYELPYNDGRLSDMNQGLNGDLIFTNMSERKMYYAENKNGEFLTPKPMDIEFGIHGYISPNEDYLLVNAPNKDNQDRKDHDIFVYFKEKNGSWSKPLNLGLAVNTHHTESVARITPDGKFLFFGRYNEPSGASNIYWVSTQVIHELKKQYFSK
ncbi:hypothetical protein [Shewanella waksmanii]|uniref:hypothetical protein n=1 Tax=Shewanella waksmanii TaxID=213783 RepID=UPI00373676B2